LLGGKFLSLVPGGEEEMLPDGGQIAYTESGVNLEEMIGKFIFSAADNKAETPKEAVLSAPAVTTPIAPIETIPATDPPLAAPVIP
jgi:phospholipid/cholesterol/gamma-HCH transport system substrate-binding protein